jgi:hypothetical protein
MRSARCATDPRGPTIGLRAGSRPLLGGRPLDLRPGRGRFDPVEIASETGGGGGLVKWLRCGIDALRRRTEPQAEE